MPPFRDDHILLISPGSTWTLAQLGLPESFTPARVRIPSRMFPGVEEGTWLPNKVHELKEGQEMILGDGEVVKVGPGGKPHKKRKVAEASSKTNGSAKPTASATAPANGTPVGSIDVDGAEKPTVEPKPEPVESKGDTAMADATDDAEHHDEDAEEDGNEDDEDHDMNGTKEKDDDENADGKVYYEDDFDEEGAVWCMEEGKIVNWECFFALLSHVHEHISPTFHTPILMISQPCWTFTDKERICQFIFEKIKAPGFSMMDAATSVCWAYGIATATIIDVGYEKTDVSPVVDFVIQELARTTISAGGNSMNKQLQKLLPHLSEDEVEQLKHNSICEILPAGVPIPGEESEKPVTLRPPELNTTGMGGLPAVLKGPEEEATEEEDIAAIVASGKTDEFLAKKEKEKAEKRAGLASGEKKLPNYKRDKNTFIYVEKLHDHAISSSNADEAVEVHDEERMDVDPGPAAVTKELSAAGPSGSEIPPTVSEGEAQPPVPSSEENRPDNANIESSQPTVPTASPPATADPDKTEAPKNPSSSLMESMFSGTKDDDEAKRAQDKALRREEKKRQEAAQSGERRKEIEVGTERFKAAEGGILHAIADAVHRCISKVDEISKRGECWESIIIVGNGSRVKGFKDALITTMAAKYQISPSSGTIFTSELPSNMTTPGGTGANTPQPSTFSSQQPNALLLQAAANNAAAAAAAAQQQFSSAHHSQVPTTIRTVKIPEYFPEWKDAGFEECSFLGAQVAAKVIFINDQNSTTGKGFVTRIDYNEHGPQAIRNI